MDPQTLTQQTLTLYCAIGLALAGSIPLAMKWLKKRFPRWDKKAWAPPLIGAATMLITGLAMGNVTTWQSALLHFLVGWATGASASSGRDIAVGK